MFPQVAVLTGLYAVIRELQNPGHTQYDSVIHNISRCLHHLGNDFILQGLTR